MTKAVVYCRVSTEDQAKKYSLAAQEKDCRKFAEREGAEVSKVFIERGKSAKDLKGRPELQQLIAYVIANQIDWVIIYRLDRISRDMLKTLELYRDLSKHNIRIMSVTENNDETPSGNLQRNINAAMAQYERELLSKKVTRGMVEAVQEGRWVFNPPIGYQYTIDKHKKKLLVPSEGSEFVKRVFELAETGQYTFMQIWEQSRFFTTKSTTVKTVEHAIHNPLYAGYLKTGWFADYLPGIHKPLITKEQFWAVQKLYSDLKNNNPHPKVDNPDFPLKGILRCHHCGGKITGSWSQGRGKKYAYYRCLDKEHKGCKLNITRKLVTDNFLNLLKHLELDEFAKEIFNLTLLHHWKKSNKRREVIIDKNRRRLETLEDKKQKLIDLLMDDVIDRDTFKTKRINIESEIMATKIHVGETDCDLKEFEARLIWANNFLSNQAQLWLKADHKGKMLIQSTIFPNGITIDREGVFRTALTTPIFNLIDSISVCKKKNGGA